MIPRDTEYKLATTPSDYGRCHSLSKKMGLPNERLGWPTVVAERDGKIVGFLSTHKRSDALMAGPLVIAKDGSQFTALRLIEWYESILQQVGVSHYWFTAETEEMSATVKKLMSRFGGVTVSAETDGKALYRRDLAKE